MAKKLLIKDEAVQALMQGIEKISSITRETLGPKGRYVAIERSYGSPILTKDGVTVAKEVSLQDPCENIGAQLIREVASKANDVAGDGTTTAVVLASAIAKEGLKGIQLHGNPVAIKRGIEKAIDHMIGKIRSMSQKVDICSGGDENSKLCDIAKIAANNDCKLGKIISEAIRKCYVENGNQNIPGAVTVEEGTGQVDLFEQKKGYFYDKGWESPHYATAQSNNTDSRHVWEQNDCNVLIMGPDSTLKDIHSMSRILSKIFIENSSEKYFNKHTLILCPNLLEDTKQLLIYNNGMQRIKVCCASCPSFGQNQKDMLDDIAAITGGEVIDGLTTTKEEVINNLHKYIGMAKKIKVSASETIIFRYEGDDNDEHVKRIEHNIKKRLELLHEEMKNATSDYDRSKIQERIAKINGSITVIKVGGTTESEIKEKKYRIEDAINATRAAIEEGIVPGGGISILKAASSIDEDELVNPSSKCDEQSRSLEEELDEKYGVQVVKKAAKAPLYHIAENAGAEPQLVVNTVMKSKCDNYGFDASKREYCDLIKAGIIDPTKVVISSLKHAASIAQLLITTSGIIVEKPEKKCCCSDSNKGMPDMM